ncbi:MAG: V-type ATP synthase subunit A [Candidatus Scalindua sp. AMX11]|nr:MAG: V-type ATP synthase subunit A [Candidatus Scalindua sp.]NOG84292.1 V-type ATP synthase subunit A [Planctomycetota bacterium]RZV67161.1 MAG: V-type ATP synthase subunit A [Candidatus Scalindua sp. SCAELEC01]TDE63662.1 MAG: V-type ATP synthase subunit A [Candidatus Scalindua sp. AMX11]GJQ60791.1 MAG: V-type ATP synthase alpha chain [Candidatus Scalindua sp.]
MTRESEHKVRGEVRVVTVRDSLVTVEVIDLHIRKNEVGFICVGDERLMAEVLRIQGATADMQVFEETDGVRVGDKVEMTGEMLSVTLGPGLLSQVFDGLQNPLEVLASKYGFFLPRGVDLFPLDQKKRWLFTPSVSIGDTLMAGQVIGSVPEGRFNHKIMVPFDLTGTVVITRIQEGSFTIEETIAHIKTSKGDERELTLAQRWPVRKPVPEKMYKSRVTKREYPHEPLTTTTRIIDTFFPIARGGTACIPGPFGAGKTVLQNLISRYSHIDIVIIVACGERAGEVVETITEFPNTPDPLTGGVLMDRTIIICNTSSMPVAARESSIYTGVTLGEYYRQMGYHVLLIADSTSRWAQAMRETSGRMEEIPGEEAFPAYLDSSIKNIYERAGVIKTPDNAEGSLTMIGTVSPAGGNFEEPVTQATLGTVKTFLGLSSARAYKRFYPAIDPLISWSRYLDQLKPWFDKNINVDWVSEVKMMHEMLHRGEAIYQMMQVTGEEGITIEDYIDWQKSTLIDMVFLQQDAFDEVDITVSSERQQESFALMKGLITEKYTFKDKDECRDFFTKITGLYKNFNYSPIDAPAYKNYKREITALSDKYLGI